ncbi:hypothetical protein ScalyP_jg11826, partial [Parmales sp. scaly parma]
MLHITVHEARELQYTGEATFVEVYVANTGSREAERTQRSASTPSRINHRENDTNANPSWKSASFEFHDLSEKDAQDGEIIVKIKEETRNFKENEVASTKIALEKAIDGFDKKPFRLITGGLVRISASFKRNQSNVDTTSSDSNSKLSEGTKVEARY